MLVRFAAPPWPLPSVCTNTNMASVGLDGFVSYSRREELKPFVSKLKHDLESRGVSAWLDIEDIPAGADSYAVTGSALHSSGCLIAVLSNCYLSSKYSTSELYVADADSKPIIPVIYEPVDYQQSQKAMGVKYVVGGLVAVSFITGQDDYSLSLNKLIAALKQYKEKAIIDRNRDLSSQLAELTVSDDATPFAPPTESKDTPVEQQDVIEEYKENPFRVGMKLEANDRRFPYYVCVATIEDVRGDEIKIHFDGWGPEYDYWCSYDQIELHPVGWCARNGYELQPPRGIAFANWNKYLSQNQSEPCDAPMFNEIQTSPSGSLHFRVGMKLEAKDRKNPGLTCVASIIDIDDKDQLLIHFDGWSEIYDYWCKPDTTDIHPPMWCGKNGRQLEPPHNHPGGGFRWNSYLHNPANNPAPAHIFTEQQLDRDPKKEQIKERDDDSDDDTDGSHYESD